MVEWLVIVLSILMPLVLVPALLPTLVLMAKRKRIVDAPSFRKTQRRPVSLMGGMLVVAVMATSLCCASLYVPLNDLFPAMCMVVLMMTIGLIDDAIDLHYNVKFIIQLAVATLLCFAGNYRITSLWTVFGIEMLHPLVSCALSVFVGVVIMNAINFMDGIDGLSAVYGLFVGIVMAVWGWHHQEMSHSILSLIMASSMFAFWIFNGFSEKYKIYLGDSGSLVLGLYVYLSVCKILSHREPQMHLSNGYEVAFVTAMLSTPVFDLIRVTVSRMIKGHSPFKPDRSHLHHLMVDMGYSHQTACLIIVMTSVLSLAVWGLLIEWKATHTMHFCVICLTAAALVWSPAFQIQYLRDRHPDRYRRYQTRIRKNRLRLSHRHEKFTRIIDQLPTIIR